jgi:glycosidase
MPFPEDTLAVARPERVRDVALPRRQTYHPSPHDWRDEVLYFLLPDRFSNGQETPALLLDRSNIGAARPAGFRWDDWARSGSERWQGGTIAGITSKLDYLKDLGMTTIWVGPAFKQRGHIDSYHGYAIQDFLDVDARFGTRQDLVDLVKEAHRRELRIILDIIFNHSGRNWDYEGGQVEPPYRPWPDFYQKGQWLNRDGNRTNTIATAEDGVWPEELRADDNYTRAGHGSLSGEEIENDRAQMKRTDFDGAFRDFNFDGTNTLNDLARCYKYWIALTDCDGFRLDTLKHVPYEAARNFCGTVKEFASTLGKANFFLVGEVGGPDENAGKYLDVLELNLNATLDIGGMRRTLQSVAKGLSPARDYFSASLNWIPFLGSHRNSGPRHVTVLDDHDHVSGDKVRFSSDAASSHQVVAGVAMQLFALGIPCVYYGTEQALAGPEKSERDQYLPDYHGADKYLREIMFAADHPRASGRAGLQAGAAGLDAALPAFGAFGTVGRHCFDPAHEVYVRIRALARLRQAYPVLRYGRQYLRDITNFNGQFQPSVGGELVAWSRILDDEEALCVVNSHGTDDRGGDIVVSGELNAAGSRLTVLVNTAEVAALAQGAAYTGTHPTGSTVPVKRPANSPTFIEVRDLGPSEVLVFTNRP